VILIQWGTFGRQKTLQGTLTDIAAKVLEEKFSNPSIILVGDVISLREKINWFEKMPLYGRQILFARTGVSVSGIAKELMEKGADVIEFPKWKKTKLPVELGNITGFDKILFSSPERVDEFFSAVNEKGIDIRKITADFYGCSSKSINALRERGFIARLIDDMPQEGSLLVVGEDSKYEFENADFLVTSKKELDQQFLPIFQRMLQEADVNTMVFPSAASVEVFIESLKECGIDVFDFLKDVQVVCMGRKTKETAKSAGLIVDGMPDSPTRKAMVEYLVQSRMPEER
jgi:uroporphyrinogen-III synthase